MEVGMSDILERQIILGAGASRNCDRSGFPLGSDLRNEILGLLSTVNVIINSKNTGSSRDIFFKLKEFLENFTTSKLDSIDAFIARTSDQDNVERRHQQGFMHDSRDISSDKIGRALIAAIIRHYQERKTAIEWYGKLIPLFFPPIKLQDSASDILKNFEKNIKKLRVITFNYDISLECFLYGFLEKNYNKREDFKDEYTKKMLVMIKDSINHVYGAIYKPSQMIDEIIRHSKSEPTSDSEKEAAQKAYDSVKIINNAIEIYNNHNDSKKGHDIQVMERGDRSREAAVKKCDYLYVLGFGFDRENINNIGLNSSIWRKGCFATNKGDNKKIKIIALDVLSKKRILSSRELIISEKSVKEALEEDFSLSEKTLAERIPLTANGSISPYFGIMKYEK
jgi:hypothetical protein